MRKKITHYARCLILALCVPASPVSAENGDGVRRDPAVVELLDRQALQQLVLRYARAVDRKDFDRLCGLYHPDAHHDHGGMFAGSPAEMVRWLRETMVDIETQHLIANSLFSIQGTQAQGEIYSVNFHYFPKSGRNYIAGGRYLDRYEKRDGIWRFTSRRRVIDWSEERPASSAQTAATLIRGAPYPNDLSYEFQLDAAEGDDTNCTAKNRH